jgi:GNAT superfamily N-acetyltransferase
MIIRKAVAADESQFVDLLKLFPPGETMAGWASVGEAFQRIVKDPELGVVLVADESGVLLGEITLSYPVAARCGGTYTCIEEFMVSDKARGKGVGGKLMEAALAEARAKGCFEIQVNNPSQMGYPVYMRYGFTDLGKHLKQMLNHADTA